MKQKRGTQSHKNHNSKAQPKFYFIFFFQEAFPTHDVAIKFNLNVNHSKLLCKQNDQL